MSFACEGSAATVRPGRRRMGHLPASLDAILPGLGHLVGGRRARAGLFGIPVIALILLAAEPTPSHTPKPIPKPTPKPTPEPTPVASQGAEPSVP